MGSTWEWYHERYEREHKEKMRYRKALIIACSGDMDAVRSSLEDADVEEEGDKT